MADDWPMRVTACCLGWPQAAIRVDFGQNSLSFTHTMFVLYSKPQAIAERPERRLVEAPICRKAARGWIADRRGVCSECDHGAALQQPNEAGAVVAAQP
jgi:hypothetical protein